MVAPVLDAEGPVEMPDRKSGMVVGRRPPKRIARDWYALRDIHSRGKMWGNCEEGAVKPPLGWAAGVWTGRSQEVGSASRCIPRVEHSFMTSTDADHRALRATVGKQ